MRQPSGAASLATPPLLLLAALALALPDAAAGARVAVVSTDAEAQPLLLQVARLLAADHQVTVVLYGGRGPAEPAPFKLVQLPAAAADPSARLSWLDRWERFPLLTPDAVVASRVAGCSAVRASGVLAQLRPELVVATLFLDDACLLGLLPDVPVLGLLPSVVGLPWLTYQLGGHYPVSRLPVHGYPLGAADFYARLGNAWRWWTLLRRVQRMYQVPVASAGVGHVDLEAAYDRVEAVYISGDGRLQEDVPSDHRLRFLGCIECAHFNELPKRELSAVSSAGLLVIRLHHPYVMPPDEFSSALAEGAASSPLTPLDVSNATAPGARRVVRSAVPAADALAHPRARAFISECSPASVLLGVHFSVPLVCIPFTAGHKMATARAVSLGFAVEVDRRTLTAEAVRDAIRSVTGSAPLRRALRTRADTVRHDAVSPAAQLAHDVHHLVLFGRHRRQRRPVGLVEYYCLDVIGTCLMSGGVAAAMLLLLFGWFYRVLTTRVKAKKE